MSTVDKAALLGRRIDEADHEIPGVGTVRIRGLSRAQALELRKIDDPVIADRRLVVLGLVDPPMTEDDVRVWQENSRIHEIEGLTVAIGELSGQGEGAAKSGVPGV